MISLGPENPYSSSSELRKERVDGIHIGDLYINKDPARGPLGALMLYTAYDFIEVRSLDDLKRARSIVLLKEGF